MSINGDIRAMLDAAISGVTVPTDDGKLMVCLYVPEQLTPPCAILTPSAWTVPTAAGYEEATREWIVQIVTGRTADQEAQALLDDLVETSGSASVIAAINTALAGQGYVTAVDEYVALPIGDLSYVACNVRIRIYTDH